MAARYGRYRAGRPEATRCYGNRGDIGARLDVDSRADTLTGIEEIEDDTLAEFPEEGLLELFQHWSGPGELWRSLAAVEEHGREREWTRQEVESRAHRVLLQQLQPSIQRWPVRIEAWLERLPVVTVDQRFDSTQVQAGVSWSRTLRRYGWPPMRFRGRRRNRAVDSLLVTTIKWALERLATIYGSARILLPTVGEHVARQLDAALVLRSLEPVASAEAIRPTVVDTRAIRAEGTPWSHVAEVCDAIRQVDVSLLELSRRALYPEPELRGRLFHLAILGLILRELRELDYPITSKRPIGAASLGPAYSVACAAGQDAHLWFEAAGAWRFYNRRSPYVEAAAGVAGAGRPLGADAMLVLPDRGALLVECKYSLDAQRVARDGYEQVVAYAAEAAHRLAPQIAAVVVGPREVVGRPHRTTLGFGTVTITHPAEVRSVVREFLALMVSAA